MLEKNQLKAESEAKTKNFLLIISEDKRSYKLYKKLKFKKEEQVCVTKKSFQ